MLPVAEFISRELQRAASAMACVSRESEKRLGVFRLGGGFDFGAGGIL
jgi:hypothetical protein